ncbi:MAG: 2-C-methyl-D-erythritol 2,4-cyclodiphosphate synthase [Oligoflexia bacterium]|nr:2-C-methyl-D-erythritol 2,4-cyclodiphosphate synthase [Oligoflexia bacterium]
MFRIGLGSDIHKFEKGRKLVLGGVEIPHTHGLMGHSDADVVLHALADALLGALALGDLGKYFPGDEKNKNRNSLEILKEVCTMVWEKGYKVVNTDIVIMAEAPKIAGYRAMMCEKISEALNINRHCVGIKATTCEGLGAIGRSEGIYAQAIVLLKEKKYD